MDAYVRPQQGGDFERVDFEQSQSWNYEGMTKKITLTYIQHVTRFVVVSIS